MSNNCTNKNWLRSDCAALYQELLNQNATRVTKRARLLRLALTRCRRGGRDALYLEFGVHEGKDLARMACYLATLDKLAIFHGFDSFEGLPEDWDNGQLNAQGQLLHAAGAFDVNGKCPQLDQVQSQLDMGKRNPVPSSNVQLHKGWFHETVPPFLDQHASSGVAFVHADAELYSSTITFLKALCQRRLFKKGSILVFDEYWNYENWQDGEYRAWMEVVQEYDMGFQYIGYHAPSDGKGRNTYGYQSVCVMVTKDM